MTNEEIVDCLFDGDGMLVGRAVLSSIVEGTEAIDGLREAFLSL